MIVRIRLHVRWQVRVRAGGEGGRTRGGGREGRADRGLRRRVRVVPYLYLCAAHLYMLMFTLASMSLRIYVSISLCI